MNRGHSPLLADKENISDSWKLLCATAELIADFSGADKYFEAALKFTNTVGEVGVKLIEPKSSIVTLPADTRLDVPETPKNGLNIEPLLSSLGISGISLTSENLLRLLSKYNIETTEYSIHLATDNWSTLPWRWHQGRINLLTDARLSLKKRNNQTPTIVLSFGRVQLGGTHYGTNSIELALSDKEAATEDEFEPPYLNQEPKRVRIRLEYWPDSRGVLKKLGVHVVGRYSRIASFTVIVSVVKNPSLEYQCVLLLGGNFRAHG